MAWRGKYYSLPRLILVCVTTMAITDLLLFVLGRTIWESSVNDELGNELGIGLIAESPKFLRTKMGVKTNQTLSVQVPPEQQEDSADEVGYLGFMTQQGAVQLERRAHLKQACARHPELSQGGLNNFTLRHLYAHEKHKILYCFVPKVGCSNWKRVLMVLSDQRNSTDEISNDDAHFKNGMERLSGLSPAEQQHRLKTYTKFMYTRQPFIRILSVYMNKFADIKVYRSDPYFQMIAKRIMKRYRKDATTRELKTGENMTWYEWTSYLTNPSEKANFDDHWQEIYKMCSPCKVNYDYLGWLETIGDDAKYMLTALNLEDTVSYPTKANSHPTNSSETYKFFSHNTNKTTLGKLWEVYQTDFELFGYPKPDLECFYYYVDPNVVRNFTKCKTICEK
ncbi:carbohydrate sulfotransferase 11-like [Asterias rubens]|uniref:carbohydrate sulfotransferase 11-like n=1 Tax=Asterias rubens TaxID=7604 RepID=UPI001455D695|nr:carbohydrate sulfotransferase 11-like [Asterias rubens]